MQEEHNCDFKRKLKAIIIRKEIIEELVIILGISGI